VAASITIYLEYWQTKKTNKLTRSNTGTEDDPPVPLSFHMGYAQLGQLGPVIYTSARLYPGRQMEKNATDQESATRIDSPSPLEFV
jgi:hypothetical protein